MAYSDDEQVEALKRWWQENGRSIVAGVVIAVVAVVGWQQWNAYQRTQAEAASSEYQAFLEQIQAEDAGEGAVQRGEALLAEYPGTPYAPLTAFWLAQYHVQQDQLDAAAERLQWALDHAGSDPIRHLARLRLAQVRLGQDDLQGALALLSPVPDGAFAASYEELRGDVLAAQGEAEDAAAAYRRALADQDLPGQRRGIIEIKLNDLGQRQEPLS